MKGSTFEHNDPVAVVKAERFRGHSGGLSIELEAEGPTVVVSNCIFRNNTSDPKAVHVQRTSDLLKRFVFTGRGGGCIIIVAPNMPLTVLVENSTFEDNFARTIAGGLYVGYNGSVNHTVTINRVKLIKNQCPGVAGGLSIS